MKACKAARIEDPKKQRRPLFLEEKQHRISLELITVLYPGAGATCSGKLLRGTCCRMRVCICKERLMQKDCTTEKGTADITRFVSGRGLAMNRAT